MKTILSDNKTQTITVKPDKISLRNLLIEIANGNITIPIFQRDFIWTGGQMKDFFDSVFKGYPVGSLLFWKPKTDFKIKDKIGPYQINVENKNTSYVLDGSQRITTLFGVLTNPAEYHMKEDDDKLKEFRIFYNLKEKEFTFLRSKRKPDPYNIPLYKVIDTYALLDFLRTIEDEVGDLDEAKNLIDNAKQLNKILYDYEIPFVEIKGGKIKDAAEIFSRINSKGTEISEDFMLSALSYNLSTNFLLSKKIGDFRNSLALYNFDQLKRNTILDCISNSKGKIYFDVKIEDLKSDDLESRTINTFIHLKKAIDFLYKKLFVLDTRHLPYPTQLIFLSEFFRLNPEPSYELLNQLQKWFWITSYSNYFTIYSLSQQREAYKVFCKFATEGLGNGIYKLNIDKFTASKFPEKLNFIGVRVRTLRLFLLRNAYNEKTFQSNDGIKETLIFDSEDKTPANTLIRLSSVFESEPSKKNIKDFINQSNLLDLNSYFLDEKTREYFNQGKVETFLNYRRKLIQEKERDFVTNLDIRIEEISKEFV